MSLIRTARPFRSSPLAALALLTCLAWPAAAQEPPDPNPGAITISGALDITNAYMFRGIPQDEGGGILWPYFDLGLALYSGDGGLKSVGVNFGTWNSLHGGHAGLDGSSGKLWYESDFYVTLGLGFGGGTSAGVTYTSYTSPNGGFATTKEIAIKLAVDDSAHLGAAAVRPYALFAFEMDTEAGVGQADGGFKAGKYLELGIAPGATFGRAALSVPVKVGLSMGDYYEGLRLDDNGDIIDPFGIRQDDTFGYFSLAGVVTVPLTSMATRFGSWNVHGGVEYQRLGIRNASALEVLRNAIDTPDGGPAPPLGPPERNQVIATIGIGFTY